MPTCQSEASRTKCTTSSRAKLLQRLCWLSVVGLTFFGFWQTVMTVDTPVGVSFSPEEHSKRNNGGASSSYKDSYKEPSNHLANETESAKSLLVRSLLYDIPHPAMKCDTNHDKGNPHIQVCCVPWDVNVDEWWTHHPDWTIVDESTQQCCFAKFPEPKATFFRNLYKTQFMHDGNGNLTGNGMDIYRRKSLPPRVRNCSNVFRYNQVISGVGAILRGQLTALYYASKNLQRPFQMSMKKTWNHWKYVGTSPDLHWSWCPTKGLDCFLLPIGNCPHVAGLEQSDRIRAVPHIYSRDYAWYVQYLLRYQHKVRWRLRKFMDEHDGHIHGPNSTITFDNCTTFHIRRGDAGLHYQPFRRYPSLLEYIQAGKVRQDEPIVLLTDDVTTIQEATQFYPDYTWILMNRPRSNMTYGGFGSHIHVGDGEHADPGDAIVAMLSEARAAARCRKVVHANSGFVLVLLSEYFQAEWDPPQIFIVNTNVPREEAVAFQGAQKHDRAQAMINEIFREAAEEYQKRMANAELHTP
uniref:Uncharacterized protein n=1 Tax=Amphora coffeiformis TaxID=265554 RepID=A0A7S3P474_9STRA|mmetsp:Transcript_3638/g.7390  ORF Transcript_3638/g.7390 Transcript_3638/m.7390 type:complete len:523 (-) Transcript_3638:354-1922(-)|eukprot:scaffold1221_cov207-Amphora_coffeaeformis.AAC.2